MSIKKVENHDKFKRVGSVRVPIVQNYGVTVPEPTIKISDNHPCKGCIWYSRNTDVLFCPFPNCVRKKKGIGNAKEDENAD